MSVCFARMRDCFGPRPCIIHLFYFQVPTEVFSTKEASEKRFLGQNELGL